MERTAIPQPEVLVIEPEALSRQYVVQALQQLELHPHVTNAFAPTPDSGVHLVILGLNVDPVESLLRLEQAQKHCPMAWVMGVSPRIAPTDRIALLNAGLDFIIEKPFFVEECVSAVQAIFRRLQPLQARSSRHLSSHDGTPNETP